MTHFDICPVCNGSLYVIVVRIIEAHIASTATDQRLTVHEGAVVIGHRAGFIEAADDLRDVLTSDNPAQTVAGIMTRQRRDRAASHETEP